MHAGSTSRARRSLGFAARELGRSDAMNKAAGTSLSVRDVLVTVPTRGGRSFNGRFAGKLWHHDHRTEKTGPQMTAKVRRVL